jgi:hypothetical protein
MNWENGRDINTVSSADASNTFAKFLGHEVTDGLSSIFSSRL